jgi:uncharacterized protein YndB with AHSA1/START domain
MGHFVYSVWIKATPAQVWRFYVDPHRIPRWQTGRPVIEDVHGSPGSPGSSYVSSRGRLRARTVVVESSVPTRLLTRTDAYLGLRFEVTSRLTAHGDGTDLELTAVTHWPPGRRLIGTLLERMFLGSREARKELAYLKGAVEAGAAR